MEWFKIEGSKWTLSEPCHGTARQTISTSWGFRKAGSKHTSFAELSKMLQSSRSAVPPFSTRRPPPCEL
eukprot:scaffold47919_cov72-Phaeocystis_antarctica.AAC.1